MLLGAAATAAVPAGAGCPAADAPLHEVFVAADRPEAWSAPPPADAARPGWRLDWITPAGDDAALAAAALPDAAERLARRPPPGADAGPQSPLSPGLRRAARAAALAVRSGPAWQGYFALELRLQRPGALPPGSRGWLALVEALPAGSEGSPQARTLVRGVAGPLPLAGTAPLTHLHALRWPEGARPARLQARAWVEGPDGRVLAMAGERCGSP